MLRGEHQSSGEFFAVFDFVSDDSSQIFFGEPPVPPQPSPSEGVTLSPFLDGSLCFIKLFGFSELQGPYAMYVIYPDTHAAPYLPLIPHSAGRAT